MTVEQLMLDLAAEKANNQKAEVNLKTLGGFSLRCFYSI
jgi:hypothetical protein